MARVLGAFKGRAPFVFFRSTVDAAPIVRMMLNGNIRQTASLVKLISTYSLWLPCTLIFWFMPPRVFHELKFVAG